MTPVYEIHDCNCGAAPGQPHIDGCEVERCSSCGGQKVQCLCTDHDPLFSRWIGIYPGQAEAMAIGYYADKATYLPVEPDNLHLVAEVLPDLNRFGSEDLHKIFFVKPTPGAAKEGKTGSHSQGESIVMHLYALVVEFTALVVWDSRDAAKFVRSVRKPPQNAGQVGEWLRVVVAHARQLEISDAMLWELIPTAMKCNGPAYPAETLKAELSALLEPSHEQRDHASNLNRIAEGSINSAQPSAGDAHEGRPE